MIGGGIQKLEVGPIVSPMTVMVHHLEIVTLLIMKLFVKAQTKTNSQNFNIYILILYLNYHKFNIM